MSKRSRALVEGLARSVKSKDTVSVPAKTCKPGKESVPKVEEANDKEGRNGVDFDCSALLKKFKALDLSLAMLRRRSGMVHVTFPRLQEAIRNMTECQDFTENELDTMLRVCPEAFHCKWVTAGGA